MSFNKIGALAESILWGMKPSLLAKWCKMELDPWQSKLIDDDARQIVACTSRQIGKSTAIALKALGRFLSGYNELILVIAPTLRQSVELMNKIKLYLEFIPGTEQIRKKALSISDDVSHNRVVALPGGNPDNIRGFSGPSLIIIDEDAYAKDKLYYSVRPMLMTTNGQLVLISTPFVKHGHFYEAFMSTKGWSRYHVPATDCPRVTKDFLDGERQAMGEWWFKSEYMGIFQDPVDSVFSAHDIDRAMTDIEPLYQYNAPNLDAIAALYA